MRPQPSFPAAILHLIQQEFNKSFHRALERQKRVQWPDFDSLRQALAAGEFRPELVALSGEIAPPERLTLLPAVPRRVATKAPPQETGTPPPPLAHQIRNQCQEEEQNPYPAPLLQVGPGFLIRRVIDDTASQGVDIPETDDGRHFCLSFHLKGMCNSNCGGRHSHRALSQSKFGRLVGWCEKFCSEEAAPPVREVDAGGRSQASTLFSRTGRPRGIQGTQITTGGEERNHPPPQKNLKGGDT